MSKFIMLEGHAIKYNDIRRIELDEVGVGDDAYKSLVWINGAGSALRSTKTPEEIKTMIEEAENKEVNELRVAALLRPPKGYIEVDLYDGTGFTLNESIKKSLTKRLLIKVDLINRIIDIGDWRSIKAIDDSDTLAVSNTFEDLMTRIKEAKE